MTLVKSDTTSNDTILYSGGIVIFLNLFMNALLFLIVYCDSFAILLKVELST